MRRFSFGLGFGFGFGLGNEAPHHVRHHSTMLEELDLNQSVQPQFHREFKWFRHSILPVDLHHDTFLPWSCASGHGDGKVLGAVQPERCCSVAVVELERHHTHPYQIRTVDPFVALREEELYAQQRRPFRGPIAS